MADRALVTLLLASVAAFAMYVWMPPQYRLPAILGVLVVAGVDLWKLRKK